MENFEIIARAVIIQDNKILLCKRKDRDYYFLPGGHIEFGERADEALAREIKEELGVETRAMSFIGTMENIFTENGERHHEFNVFFSVELAENRSESCEEHLCFAFANIANLARENILPAELKIILSSWLENKQIFWASQLDILK